MTNPTVSVSSTVSPPGSCEAAGGGVERGEEAVLDQHAGVGEAVEQGRLAGVGVADDRHAVQARALRALRWVRRTPLDVRRSASSLWMRRSEAPAVDLELGLAGRPTGADAASPAGESALPLPRRRGSR